MRLVCPLIYSIGKTLNIDCNAIFAFVQPTGIQETLDEMDSGYFTSVISSNISRICEPHTRYCPSAIAPKRSGEL
jgi:hypothetical protein